MPSRYVSVFSPRHCSSAMPTVVVNVSNQRVLVTAAVSLPTERGDNDPREFEALVDTGAQCTMVTRRVVERVGAEQIGIRQFMPASGRPQATALYRLSIAVPVSETDAEGIPSFTFARGGTVPVMLLPFDPSDCEVLLGMDILTKFHITMCSRQFFLSN